MDNHHNQTEHFHAHMDRRIFDLDLSVEATSAYIVVTSLLEQNQRPSLEAIRTRWTKSDSELNQVLNGLVDRRILRLATGSDGRNLYYPNPASLWK